LISALVPILANAVRAYLIVVLAYLSNNRIAVGVDHVIYGWVFFSLVTAMLIGLALGWREPEVPPAPPALNSGSLHGAPVRVIRLLWWMAAVVLIVVSASSAADFLWSRTPLNQPAANQWSAPEGWLATVDSDHDWAPNFEDLQSETSQTFTEGSREVFLFVATYPVKRGGVELVNASNAVGAYGEWDLLRSGYRNIVMEGRRVAVAEYFVAHGSERRVVWVWYLTGGQLTASPYKIKLVQAESRLLGRPQSVSLFAVSARLNSQASQAVDDLSTFVMKMSFQGRTDSSLSTDVTVPKK
jgi:EpsI family protein